jgi:GNAT superfamily N-acetyltransferase
MPAPDPPGADTIAIRVLRETDLASAFDLERRERWNQTTADWQRLLRLDPRGAFAALDGERLVGTVTTITYGRALAWIGMMLVAEAFRGRRIGNRLMRAALGYCTARGVATVKLDATPAGRPYTRAWASSRKTRSRGGVGPLRVTAGPRRIVSTAACSRCCAISIDRPFAPTAEPCSTS